MPASRSFSALGSFLLLFGLVGCATKAPPPPKSQESFLLGEPMPPFHTQTMSGKPVVSESYSGQPVVIVFGTTDCASCERVYRDAESVFHDYEEVVFIAVIQDNRADLGKRLAARLGLSYPVVLDADGVLSRQYRASEVPRTFVIDAQGLVRWIGGPTMARADLAAALEAFPRH